MLRLLYFYFLWICLCTSCFAGQNHPEKWYQDKWCAERKGKTEVVLKDMTRCDCLTETHAIEFDFGYKWAEAIGQALHYSLQTGKKAGIVLIIKSPKDQIYWTRLTLIINHYNLTIDTWPLKTQNLIRLLPH